MSFKVKTCDKQYHQVEWRVVVPRVGDNLVSPKFTLSGQNWIFRFITSWKYEDEYWAIDFEKVNASDLPTNFLLTIHIKSENRYIYLNHVVIRMNNSRIWNSNLKEFFKKIPRAEFSKSTLTFIFTFSYEIQDFEDRSAFKEHKSVQTTKPKAPPPTYLDDHHCLKNLSLDLGKLMDADSNSDVRLKCSDCTIPSHKLILGARSEVFRSMLQSDMQEGRTGSVEIVDMEPEIFKVFVRYFYTGFLPELSEDIAAPLFEAGDKYQVDALRDRCADFLAENLTTKNAIRILTIADAHSNRSLKDRVISYVVDEKIPNNSDVWPEFCDGHPKLANEVLNRAYKQLVPSK